MTDVHDAAADHREAVHLEWECRHIPFKSLLLVLHLGISVASAVSMMWTW